MTDPVAAAALSVAARRRRKTHEAWVEAMRRRLAIWEWRAKVAAARASARGFAARPPRQGRSRRAGRAKGSGPTAQRVCAQA
jgi:hypothetical protein